MAGILLTSLLYGRAGLREFRSRLLKWRVGARWYAVALLTAPLLLTGVMLALSLISPEFLPRIFIASDKTSVVLMGIAAGLTVGIFEELGWTGFAIPRMRLSYGVLGTGLMVGVLWGAWHLLQNYWASGVTSGESLWLADAVVGILVGQLVAHRVLMVWVSSRPVHRLTEQLEPYRAVMLESRRHGEDLSSELLGAVYKHGTTVEIVAELHLEGATGRSCSYG